MEAIVAANGEAARVLVERHRESSRVLRGSKLWADIHDGRGRAVGSMGGTKRTTKARGRGKGTAVGGQTGGEGGEFEAVACPGWGVSMEVVGELWEVSAGRAMTSYYATDDHYRVRARHSTTAGTLLVHCYCTTPA